MKNVKKLLIFAAISTFVFASSTRTDALGGAGFWADDYANIWSFPAAVNDHNVAYTNGSNFTTIMNSDGTTWGFQGGTGDDVANVMWGNGSMGVTFGLSMTPEVTADDATATNPEAEAVTDYDLGFGMPLAGGDFGFTYNSDGEIGINHRRAQSVWLWDNMLINFDMTPEDFADGATQASDMNLGVSCYTVRTYDGGTSALFGLGFAYGANGASTDGGDAPDATMGIEWNFAVESEMTDWATLRVGYSHGYDFATGGTDVADVEGTDADEQVNGFTLGLGFNYGSFDLDMSVGTTEILNDPVKYLAGRNTTPLGAGWTISYNW